MTNKTKMVQWGGMPCVEMEAGGYRAMVAYEIGSNVIRLQDVQNGIEFFRFSNTNTAQTIRDSAEVWGLPTLYLPNRFADGVLKTSDAVYQLPVNEKKPYHNHIHGFLHKRVHKLVEHKSDENCAWVKTEYLYDERDPFFQVFPVKFKAKFTFTLSGCGLEYSFSLTNLSEVQMPISVATHTTINSPFVVGGKEKDERISVPVGKRCMINERCLPTLEFAEPSLRDLEYHSGVRCPVLQNIDNEMYFAEYQDIGGEMFYGVICEDVASGKRIGYEVSENYKFWIVWNDKGFNGYFCPEPMSAMIDAPNLELPQGMTGYRELKPGESTTFTQRFFTMQ